MINLICVVQSSVLHGAVVEMRLFGGKSDLFAVAHLMHRIINEQVLFYSKFPYQTYIGKAFFDLNSASAPSSLHKSLERTSNISLRKHAMWQHNEVRLFSLHISSLGTCFRYSHTADDGDDECAVK